MVIDHSSSGFFTIQLDAAYDLGDDEGGAEEEAGHLGEAPAAGARHEDERLADDAHLQVQRRHHLVPAAVQRPHAERVLSPQGLHC